MTEPLFRSGHEALRFAYAYNAQQYPMTIMGRMMRGSSLGSGRGLHGLDGAAEAGNVKRVVGGLPSSQVLALTARYTLDEAEFRRATGGLVGVAVNSLPTGIHSARLVLSLVVRYYRRKDVRLAELCDAHGMDAATMTRRWQRVRETLRAIESAADTAADGALVAAGLVRGSL